MDFDSAQKQFDRLTRMFKTGKIDHEEYVRSVDSLTIKDDDGIEWQIGIRSGQWYRKDGEKWVEDDPIAVRRITRPIGGNENRKGLRRWLLVGFVLLLVLILLLAPKFFGTDRFLNPFGLSSLSPDISTSLSGLQGTLTEINQRDSAVGGAQLTKTAAINSTTPRSDQSIGLTSTASPSAQPSITATMPPPPRFQPQIWEERVSLKLVEGMTLTRDNDWYYFRDYPWEYEFLTQGDKTVLLLQFDEDVALWLADQPDFKDIDRTITLAIPREGTSISILCRWDSTKESGFALRITNQWWELGVYDQGSKTILAQGNQDEDFRNGMLETFRMNCTGDEIIVWAGDQRTTKIVDDRFSRGGYRLLFEANDKIGVVLIAEDQVLVHQDQNTGAGEDSIVRLGPVDVQYIGSVRYYPQIQSSPYAGESVIGLALRIVNHNGEPIDIGSKNIYLENGDQRVFANPISEQATTEPAEEDIAALILPFSLDRGEVVGRVFFVGVNPDQLETWQLVMDLINQGYGEARFNLVNLETTTP